VGRQLHRRAGGYAHTKQFKRLRRVLKRQRTVLGRVLRDVQRQLGTLPQALQDRLTPWLQRAERIRRHLEIVDQYRMMLSASHNVRKSQI
jgi:IS5 family transposase